MVEFNIINNNKEWNEKIGSFSNFNPYQVFEWREYKKDMGWKTVSLQAEHENRAGFVQMTYKKKINMFLGWIVGSIAGDVSLFEKKAFINFIKKEFFVKYAYIRTNFDNRLMPDESLSLYLSGWKKCYKKINSEYSIHGSLDNPLEEIKSSFSSNFKHNIKRGLPKNKEIRIDPLRKFNIEHIDRLFIDFKKIKDVPMPDLKQLNIIQDKLGERIIVAASYFEYEMAGLRAFLYYKNKAIDFWAASDHKGRMQYTSHVLFWKLLEKAKNIGIDSYDMAGIDPVENSNVYNFKNGTRFDVVERLGEWEITNCKLMSFLFNTLYIR